MKKPCRACGVEHEEYSIQDEHYSIFEWKSGSVEHGVPPAPIDLKGAWVCHGCYTIGGSQLENIIREADLAKKNASVNLAPEVQEILPPVVEINVIQNNKDDYWTRPMSSLFKNKERFQ